MVGIRLMAIMMVLPALAGCAKEVSTPGLMDGVDDFDEFSWPEPQRIGPDEGLFSDGTEPQYVQQMVPHISTQARGPTISPPVTVDEEGSIYIVVEDLVQKSTDHGQTWNTVLDFRTLSDDQLQDRWTTKDVALWLDGPGQTLYASFATPAGCQVLFASNDHGATWQTRTPNDWPAGCFDSRDVEAFFATTHSHSIATAPHVGALSAVAGLTNHSLYWCEMVEPFAITPGVKCSTSWDGGATYVHETMIVPPSLGCVGSFGKLATRDDGVVAAPLGPPIGGGFNMGAGLEVCAEEPSVSFSTDGGLTWDVARPTEDIVQSGASPSLAFSPDGTAYLAFRDHSSSIKLLRSPDLFQSWEGPFNITLPEHVFGVHPAVTVGDNGRVAVAYLASSAPQLRDNLAGQSQVTPEIADEGTLWQFFVATSINADADKPTWLVQQVTPNEDPVHMGCIVDPRGFRDDCTNMGHSTDIVTGPDGRAYAARIDGCTPRNGCSTDVEGAYAYRDRQAMVAVLDTGTGLLEEEGVLPSLGLEHPRPIDDDHKIYTSD